MTFKYRRLSLWVHYVDISPTVGVRCAVGVSCAIRVDIIGVQLTIGAVYASVCPVETTDCASSMTSI